VITVGIFSFAAGAVEPSPSAEVWGVDQLMQNLAQVKTAKGKFVERKYLHILETPLEFSGTLIYIAPGHLEKHTLLPKPESLVLEQDDLTIENYVKNQQRTLVLQDYPVIWAFVESIRSTLAGDLHTLNRFYNVSIEGSENQWRLLLKPKEPKMQAVVSEVRISGSKSWINSIETIEADGDRSVMMVTEDMK
jgi:hypothetical protein